MKIVSEIHIGALLFMFASTHSYAEKPALDAEEQARRVRQIVDNARVAPVDLREPQGRTPPANPKSNSTRTAGEKSVEPKTGAIWVWMPPGSFDFGLPRPPEWATEEPRRENVRGFWVMETEVTDNAYRSCESSGNCSTRVRCNIGKFGVDLEPAVCLTTKQAQDFCVWVGGRLPTSIEWEYAAKSGESRTYPWGNAEPNSTLANCHFSGIRERLFPVGSFPHGDTPWGVKDMSCNASEWTSTHKDFGYVLRGGSYQPWGHCATTTCERQEHWGTIDGDIGFRCVK